MLINVVLIGFEAYFFKKYKGHDRAVDFHISIYYNSHENR